MPKTLTFSASDIKKAKELLGKSSDLRGEIRMALATILISEYGISVDGIAALFGISKATVYSDCTKMTRPGGESAKPPGQNGRKRLAYMSFDEEAQFLKGWEKRAVKGEVTNIRQIHDSLEEALGVKVPTVTTYRIMARHGWRRVRFVPPQSKSGKVPKGGKATYCWRPVVK